MSVCEEADDELDPIWERKRVLVQLGEMYTEQLGKAAIHLTDELDTLAVFVGEVEPFDDGEDIFYEGLEAVVVILKSFSGDCHLAQIRFSDEDECVRCYDLRPDEAYFETTSQVTAQADETVYDILGRTQFDADLVLAVGVLEEILDDAYILGPIPKSIYTD